MKHDSSCAIDRFLYEISNEIPSWEKASLTSPMEVSNIQIIERLNRTKQQKLSNSSMVLRISKMNIWRKNYNGCENFENMFGISQMSFFGRLHLNANLN